MTRCVGILNGENQLGQALKACLSSGQQTHFFNLSEFSPESLAPRLTDSNWFVFNSDFLNEKEQIHPQYADQVIQKLGAVFKLMKGLTALLIKENKTAKFVFITVNTEVIHLIDFPVAPIYDEAIHSFSKSLAHELSPFGLDVYSVCTEPILEILNKDEIRSYRKKMKIFSTQKSPIKAEQVAEFVYQLLNASMGMLSGSTLCIGQGMRLSY